MSLPHGPVGGALLLQPTQEVRNVPLLARVAHRTAAAVAANVDIDRLVILGVLLTHRAGMVAMGVVIADPELQA